MGYCGILLWDIIMGYCGGIFHINPDLLTVHDIFNDNKVLSYHLLTTHFHTAQQTHPTDTDHLDFAQID